MHTFFLPIDSVKDILELRRLVKIKTAPLAATKHLYYVFYLIVSSPRMPRLARPPGRRPSPPPTTPRAASPPPPSGTSSSPSGSRTRPTSGSSSPSSPARRSRTSSSSTGGSWCPGSWLPRRERRHSTSSLTRIGSTRSFWARWSLTSAEATAVKSPSSGYCILGQERKA